MNSSTGTILAGGLWAAAVAMVALSGCASEPLAPPPPPPPTVPPLPDTRIFMYPAAGQSAVQVDRDRYECHVWAVHATGFDPSAAQVAPHARVEVVPVPPAGAGVLAGAATGAIIGAAVSRPRDSGATALVGAAAGALLGNAADQARARQAADYQQRLNDAADRRTYALEQRAGDYRRAMGACLQGRSYTIK